MSTKNSRAAGIGFGQRFLAEKYRSPSPSEYFIKTQFEENLDKNKGASMKGRLPYKIDTSRKLPGPADYSKDVPWVNENQFSIRQRRGFYYDEELKEKTCISPEKYSPMMKLISNKRFIDIGIGIGYGTKCFDKIFASSTPGVGSYDLPSVFDKTRKFTYSLN